MATNERNEAVTDVVEEQQGRLLRTIRRMLNDHAEAEDVLQDVMEDYLEAYDLGEAITSMSAWLATVASNKVLDRFRKKKRQKAYEVSVDKSEAFASDDYERQELRERIGEALEALPLEQRDVFIQNELEGKTFEEISRATGVNINTLLARKRYAVLFLRDYLKDDDEK